MCSSVFVYVPLCYLETSCFDSSSSNDDFVLKFDESKYMFVQQEIIVGLLSYQ